MSSTNLAEICEELQRLQRYKQTNLRSRIMLTNRLTATVAVYLGYDAHDEEGRKDKMNKARTLIADILDGKSHELTGLVKSSYEGIAGFGRVVKQVDKEMTALVKGLPIAAWVDNTEQRGFGLLSLATVVGEAGDLANYDNPAKLWKRMGLAPYQSQDKWLAGSTWCSGQKRSIEDVKKPTAKEFEKFGYSPRRRSVMYVVSCSLLKGNKSVYRNRYDEVKKEYKSKHPARVKCRQCNNAGKSKRGKCSNCRGTGEVMMRGHLHAMLLMSKLLLKNLWIVWNPDKAK